MASPAKIKVWRAIWFQTDVVKPVQPDSGTEGCDRCTVLLVGREEQYAPLTGGTLSHIHLPWLAADGAVLNVLLLFTAALVDQDFHRLTAVRTTYLS